MKPAMSSFRIQPTMSLASLFGDITEEVDAMPGETWIEKVQIAFDEADTKRVGELTLDQFATSRLRYLITDHLLNYQQMNDYFQQIDANCDETIQWNELLDFLISHQRSLTEHGIEKTLRITYQSPDMFTAAKFHKTSVCLRTLFIPSVGEILTLSENQLTMWSIYDCTQVRTFSDKDMFVDCCYMPCIYKIAIAKQSRQIIFYDTRTFQKHPFFISATLDVNEITKMDIDETKQAGQVYKRRRVPLFNTPTALACVPDQPIILIGDETGFIEVFIIFTSRNAKYDWASNRIRSIEMHTGPITQITYIPEIEQYVSSSVDGTIMIWKFELKTKTFSKEYYFKDPMNLSIRSFVYDTRTRDLIYTTSAHFFGVWRTFTRHQTPIDTHSQVITTMISYRLNDDLSFLVTVSKDNFFAVYRMPNLELAGNWYMGLYHDLCPPTGSILINQKYLYLVGAYISMWKVESGECDGLKPHNNTILTCFSNDIFNSVISADESGDINNWDIRTGAKLFSYTVNEESQMITCMKLDDAQRRIAIGYSDGRVKIVSANSGSILNEIDKKQVEGGCMYVAFGRVFGQKRILICTGNKTVLLFEDYSGNRINFVRNFVGHAENVSKALILKEKYLLSIGFEHEMFLWKVQQQTPLIKYQMPADPTCAVDYPTEIDFIVGDVVGYIHFMTTESPTPLKSINAFGMSIKSPITSIELPHSAPLCIASNLHGYIKFWIINDDDDSFIEHIRFRAHTETCLSVSYSEKYRVVVSTGRDEQIRLWAVEPFGLIGAFGVGRKWRINHIDSWISEEPLEDEPAHFAIVDVESIKRQLSLKNAPSVTSGVAEEEEEEKLEIPPFDLGNFLDIVDTTEDVLYSGRKVGQKAKDHLAEKPIPRHIFKPLTPQGDEELVTNLAVERTIRLCDTLVKSGGSPRIIRPNTTGSKMK